MVEDGSFSWYDFRPLVIGVNGEDKTDSAMTRIGKGDDSFEKH